MLEIYKLYETINKFETTLTSDFSNSPVTLSLVTALSEAQSQLASYTAQELVDSLQDPTLETTVEATKLINKNPQFLDHLPDFELTFLLTNIHDFITACPQLNPTPSPLNSTLNGLFIIYAQHSPKHSSQLTQIALDSPYPYHNRLAAKSIGISISRDTFANQDQYNQAINQLFQLTQHSQYPIAVEAANSLGISQQLQALEHIFQQASSEISSQDQTYTKVIPIAYDYCSPQHITQLVQLEQQTYPPTIGCLRAVELAYRYCPQPAVTSRLSELVNSNTNDPNLKRLRIFALQSYILNLALTDFDAAVDFFEQAKKKQGYNGIPFYPKDIQQTQRQLNKFTSTPSLNS